MQASHILVGLSIILERNQLMRFGMVDTDKIA